MNLFLFGTSADAERAAGVLEGLREPFFGDVPVRRWVAPSGRACAAWLAHPPERVGGARYLEAGPEAIVLRSGVPPGRSVEVAWREEGGEPQVRLDPLGAYPLYRRGRWISNAPAALPGAAGAGLRPEVLASVLGGGWSLSGDPLWEGVERVAWEAPGAAALCGAGFDAERAAGVLVDSVRRLAAWPGRPNVVPVTGGRDSRLVLAAAVRAGIDFTTVTGGAPGEPDVEIGRLAAAAVDAGHALLPAHPHGDRLGDWRRAAGVLAQITGGTATLADAAGFPLGPDPAGPAPLPLWHTGQGGEIARRYYGGADADGLVRRFLGRRPGRAGILSEAGEALVREQVGDWARAQRAAGAHPDDLGDLFYLHQRMARWAAPTHAAVEPVRDSTSPLWSAELLGDLLGLPAAARAREEFHLRVLEVLAPELAGLPFADGRGWPSRKGALGRRAARARRLGEKLRGELRRRAAALAAPDAPAPAAGDPLDRVLGELRTAATAAPDHPAWQVLDRPRVEDLLASPAAALDDMSRQYAWRLATVFGGF